MATGVPRKKALQLGSFSPDPSLARGLSGLGRNVLGLLRGLGFRVRASTGFRLQASGFRLQGSGFRVYRVRV